MSFRLRHEWVRGPMTTAGRLWSCVHCGTLRVTDGDTVVRYILHRRAPNRIVERGPEPACVNEPSPRPHNDD